MKWLTIDPPDTKMWINIEQIAYARQLGSGSVIGTADGTTHTFRNISFEDLISLIKRVDASKAD